MTMLETVARALAKADGKDPDAPAFVRYPGGHAFGICWRDQYADKARAALEAQRTWLMENVHWGEDWQDAIDAALSETEESADA